MSALKSQNFPGVLRLLEETNALVTPERAQALNLYLLDPA